MSDIPLGIRKTLNRNDDEHKFFSKESRRRDLVHYMKEKIINDI